ncbi:MAG TPA: HAD family phosphatase [Steroidobacteraceae bacterium]|nr:HAD family phosphatase [Steroidobacteraceae bacterium]
MSTLSTVSTVRSAPVRGVIFDFGGVLLRWQPEEIIARFYAEEALRTLLRESVLKHADWIEIDRGTFSEEAAIERFAARMGRPPEEMRRLMRHIEDSLIPMTDTLDIVSDLVRRGVPVYGLSNMAAWIFAALERRYTHWGQFRGIVISGEVKLIKPDPQIFHLIAGRYGLVPAETLFIDDHLPNIDCARRLGFRTIHFSDARQCARELDPHLPPAPRTPGA